MLCLYVLKLAAFEMLIITKWKQKICFIFLFFLVAALFIFPTVMAAKKHSVPRYPIRLVSLSVSQSN